MVKRLGVLEVLGSSYIGAGQNEVWKPSASTVNRNHFETTGSISELTCSANFQNN